MSASRSGIVRTKSFPCEGRPTMKNILTILAAVRLTTLLPLCALSTAGAGPALAADLPAPSRWPSTGSPWTASRGSLRTSRPGPMPGGPIWWCRGSPKPTSSPAPRADRHGLSTRPRQGGRRRAEERMLRHARPDHTVAAEAARPVARGLLWSVRLAEYRVELCWPASPQVPSPDAVEVRVYPTAFGWFGWCNDEILGPPAISADRGPGRTTTSASRRSRRWSAGRTGGAPPRR